MNQSKQPRRRAIAIDFDGCLCADAYPDIGAPNWGVITKAAREQKDGAGLILWTCREGQLLQDALEACKRWGLTFDAINESLPDWIEAFGTQPRKIGATEYWDDRAVRIHQTDGTAAQERRNRMDKFNNDMLLGSAIQLIRDIEKISFLGERAECRKVNQMAKYWLEQLNIEQKEGADHV